MFKRLDAFADNESVNYPPYNIVKLNDVTQQLQVALAGWTEDSIEVSVERRVLNVKTVTSVVDDNDYIHKGIATRSFSRNWQLSDDTIVEDVVFDNGLLRINLTKEIPEELKRKVIDIKTK